MSGNSSSLARRVMGLIVPLVFLVSCWGEGKDQLHGMYNISFSSTAVCNAQVQLIPFRNVSGTEIVIEGAAIAGGTDPLGNFALQSMVIGLEEVPSVNGVLQDIHVPAGQNYSFKVSYAPKTENETHDAILDIAYRSPQEGIIQIALQGISANRNGECSGGGGGGPVGFDGAMVLTVEMMIAATSAIQAPINTTQGQQPFVPVILPLTLNSAQGTVTLPAYTASDFVLPPPRDDIPGIGSIIQGPTNVTIPSAVSGTYDPATGSIEIPNALIHMDGALDFAADLTITLTTGRVARDSISPPVNTQALQQFGSPAHWDPVAKEVFGTPIDAQTAKVFLVGMTKLENVVLKPGARSELSTLPTASMAVLIEGTLSEAQ